MLCDGGFFEHCLCLPAPSLLPASLLCILPSFLFLHLLRSWHTVEAQEMHMEMWFGRNIYFSIYLLSRRIHISFKSHCVTKLYIFNGEKRNAVGNICSFLDIWFLCIVVNPGLTDCCCSWAICVLGAIQRGEFLGCTFHQGILEKNHEEVKKWKQPCQTTTHPVHLKKNEDIYDTFGG